MKKLFVLFVFGVFALSASLSNAVPAPNNEYYYNPETNQCIQHWRGDEYVRYAVPEGFYFSGYDDTNCTQKIFNLARYEDCKLLAGKYVRTGLTAYECSLEKNNTATEMRGAAFGNMLGENVGALPDSFFYPFKRFGEGIRLFFTFDGLEKAKLKYGFAETRLAETFAMASLNRMQLADNALNEYEDDLNEAASLKDELSAAEMNTTELADLAGNSTYRHILVLQEVYDKVPDSAKPAIRDVIERALEKQGQISQGLSGTGLVNITIIIGNRTITRQVPARFAERFLEKAGELKGKISRGVEIENEAELKDDIAEKTSKTKYDTIELCETENSNFNPNEECKKIIAERYPNQDCSFKLGPVNWLPQGSCRNCNINCKTENRACAQVITHAVKNGECKEFPTPCDVPDGWEKAGKCPSQEIASNQISEESALQLANKELQRICGKNFSKIEKIDYFGGPAYSILKEHICAAISNYSEKKLWRAEEELYANTTAIALVGINGDLVCAYGLDKRAAPGITLLAGACG